MNYDSYIQAFKTMYSNFNSLTDAQIESYLVQSSVFTNGFYSFGTPCYFALMNIAAHFAQLTENLAGDVNSPTASGNITSKSHPSAGSISYATKAIDSDTEAFLNSTSYGQIAKPFLEQCKLNKKIPLIT